MTRRGSKSTYSFDKMGEPTSRFLQSLNDRIARSNSQLERDCLLAECAAYWARQGRILDSEKLISTLRERYRTNLVDILVVRFNLAEGLIHHFRNLNSLAEDKIRRAYAISEATGDANLIAISSAWLAHMEYLSGRVNRMAKQIRRAIEVADLKNHSALARISIVVADALHLAGRIDLAQPWYRAVHFHANTAGDESTISAMMHNMAWLRCANLRQATLSMQNHTPSGELALINTESVEHYDEIVGTRSLLSLVPILKAQILSLLGSYQDALVLFENHLSAAVSEGLLRMKCYFLADQAWCRIQLGDSNGAIRDSELAASSIFSETHIDDKAGTHSRLASIYRLLGNEAKSQEQAALAESAWSSHCSLQALILAELGPLELIRIA